MRAFFTFSDFRPPEHVLVEMKFRPYFSTSISSSGGQGPKKRNLTLKTQVLGRFSFPTPFWNQMGISDHLVQFWVKKFCSGFFLSHIWAKKRHFWVFWVKKVTFQLGPGSFLTFFLRKCHFRVRGHSRPYFRSWIRWKHRRPWKTSGRGRKIDFSNLHFPIFDDFRRFSTIFDDFGK